MINVKLHHRDIDAPFEQCMHIISGGQDGYESWDGIDMVLGVPIPAASCLSRGFCECENPNYQSICRFRPHRLAKHGSNCT